MLKKKEKKIITRQTVEKVAKIAKIYLTEKEKVQMEKELNSILIAFKELEKAPVKKLEPSFHPISVKDVFREDEIEKCFSHEEALGNTIHKERNYFKGPKSV